VVQTTEGAIILQLAFNHFHEMPNQVMSQILACHDALHSFTRYVHLALHHVGSLVWLNFHACKLYYGTLISCKANLILTDNVVLKYYWIPHHVFTVGACMMFQACTHQWGKIIPTLLITPSISGLYVWWYPVIFLLITISYIGSPQDEPVRSISIWLWLL
jgi:hypothetical protein